MSAANLIAEARDQVGFAETGDAFEAARYQLAKAIAAKGRK